MPESGRVFHGADAVLFRLPREMPLGQADECCPWNSFRRANLAVFELASAYQIGSCGKRTADSSVTEPPAFDRTTDMSAEWMGAAVALGA